MNCEPSTYYLSPQAVGVNNCNTGTYINSGEDVRKKVFLHMHEIRRLLIESSWNNHIQNFGKYQIQNGLQNIGAFSWKNQSLSPVLISHPLSTSSEETRGDDISDGCREQDKTFKVEGDSVPVNFYQNCFNSENFVSTKVTKNNTSSPPRSQNKMKNHQGAIAGKIKKLCRKDKKTGGDFRLFERATQNLHDAEKEEYRNWVATYQKKDKTWTSLQTFFSTNPRFGRVFVEMIDLLLSEEFEAEYKQCLCEGKMSESAKDMLADQENKDFYRRKFTLIIDEIQGVASNYENEIRKSRKTLKTK